MNKNNLDENTKTRVTNYVQIWSFTRKNQEQKVPQNNASVFLKGQTQKKYQTQLDWIVLGIQMKELHQTNQQTP